MLKSCCSSFFLSLSLLFPSCRAEHVHQLSHTHTHIRACIFSFESIRFRVHNNHNSCNHVPSLAAGHRPGPLPGLARRRLPLFPRRPRLARRRRRGRSFHFHDLGTLLVGPSLSSKSGGGSQWLPVSPSAGILLWIALAHLSSPPSR
jgi:hypothetical protein